jgi:hypothetical protein
MVARTASGTVLGSIGGGAIVTASRNRFIKPTVRCSSSKKAVEPGGRFTGDSGSNTMTWVWSTCGAMLQLVALSPSIALTGAPPAPPPALSEMRRGEQPIDDPLVRIGPRVVDKRLYVLQLGRKAQQIETEASN